MRYEKAVQVKIHWIRMEASPSTYPSGRLTLGPVTHARGEDLRRFYTNNTPLTVVLLHARSMEVCSVHHEGEGLLHRHRQAAPDRGARSWVQRYYGVSRVGSSRQRGFFVLTRSHLPDDHISLRSSTFMDQHRRVDGPCNPLSVGQ
jgi:hypothetical protein